MKYTTEQRIAENRCDECEEIMINNGHDYGGPVICDACHHKIVQNRLPENPQLSVDQEDTFDD